MDFWTWLAQIWHRSVFAKTFRYFSKLRRGIVPSRYIFFVYLIITIGFAAVLSIPFMQTGNKKVTFLTALFTSASAFSDTGLVTTTTNETWSVSGQAIIALLIVMGGLGIFAIKIFIFNYVFRLNSNLAERELVNTERGTTNVGSLGEVIVTSMIFMFSMILISGFALTIYFYYAEPVSSLMQAKNARAAGTVLYDPSKYNLSLSFRYGFFHTISAMNNAGFDIFGNASMIPYYQNYGLQLYTMLLFIVGGIGYPVIYDFSRHLIRKIKFYKQQIMRTRLLRSEYHLEALRFSLFTKTTIITYFTIGSFMIILAIIFEVTSLNPRSIWNMEGYGTKPDRIFAIIFNITATRSAGFSTVDFANFSEVTLILAAISMFIGSSPSSTGGGIRTTTLACVILAIIAKFRNQNSVRILKRKLNDEIITMSFIVLLLSILLVGTVTLITASSLSTYGGQITAEAIDGTTLVFNTSHIFFEVASAFGTSGLSTGITAQLNTVSQLFIIVTMFIGQLGISSTILAWKSKKRRTFVVDYIEEGISIG